jgi:hypothetical protein
MDADVHSHIDDALNSVAQYWKSNFP